jgi:hypothetical protein
MAPEFSVPTVMTGMGYSRELAVAVELAGLPVRPFLAQRHQAEVQNQ